MRNPIPEPLATLLLVAVAGGLLVALALLTSCHHTVVTSGYLPAARPASSILFVYPRIAQPGAAIVVQASFPQRTPEATQCLSLISHTPNAVEAGIVHERTCGVVESRRVIWRIAEPGDYIVRLEIRINDRLGARRDERVCIVGGDVECDAPASAPAPAVP